MIGAKPYADIATLENARNLMLVPLYPRSHPIGSARAKAAQVRKIM
jgi:hypothetical protein